MGTNISISVKTITRKLHLPLHLNYAAKASRLLSHHSNSSHLILVLTFYGTQEKKKQTLYQTTRRKAESEIVNFILIKMSYFLHFFTLQLWERIKEIMLMWFQLNTSLPSSELHYWLLKEPFNGIFPEQTSITNKVLLQKSFEGFAKMKKHVSMTINFSALTIAIWAEVNSMYC